LTVEAADDPDRGDPDRVASSADGLTGSSLAPRPGCDRTCREADPAVTAASASDAIRPVEAFSVSGRANTVVRAQ